MAVLTHDAALDRRGRTCLSVLDELGAGPALVFTPEHGLHGAAQAEEAVASDHPEAESRRSVSLYGSDKASLTPKPEDFEGIELLVVDLVDVGSRYYTYVWTALLAARAAAERGVHTLVLDRPNPISGNPTSSEGRPQDPEFLSFVGLEPLPIRHALTVGEILALFLERDGKPLGADGALSIVPTRGWERFRTAEAWGRPFVPPSPNMPTLETALVYPGGCLLEGTNLSEGRGTTLPFQLVGAPFVDGERLAAELEASGVPGAQVRPHVFKPSFDKHAQKLCQGVMIQVTNAALFRPVATYLKLIALVYAQAPDSFQFLDRPYEFEHDRPAFDLLTGSSATRAAIEAGVSGEELVATICPVDGRWNDEVLEAEARLCRAAP